MNLDFVKKTNSKWWKSHYLKFSLGNAKVTRARGSSMFTFRLVLIDCEKSWEQNKVTKLLENWCQNLLNGCKGLLFYNLVFKKSCNLPNEEKQRDPIFWADARSIAMVTQRNFDHLKESEKKQYSVPLDEGAILQLVSGLVTSFHYFSDWVVISLSFMRHAMSFWTHQSS